jgi:G3E family GTPase
VHLGRFNRWVRDVLSERGDDLYRYKGLLAVAGYEERYIFQGVHMLFTGSRGRKWFNGYAAPPPTGLLQPMCGRR